MLFNTFFCAHRFEWNFSKRTEEKPITFYLIINWTILCGCNKDVSRRKWNNFMQNRSMVSFYLNFSTQFWWCDKVSWLQISSISFNHIKFKATALSWHFNADIYKIHFSILIHLKHFFTRNFFFSSRSSGVSSSIINKLSHKLS